MLIKDKTGVPPEYRFDDVLWHLFLQRLVHGNLSMKTMKKVDVSKEQ